MDIENIFIIALVVSLLHQILSCFGGRPKLEAFNHLIIIKGMIFLSTLAGLQVRHPWCDPINHDVRLRLRRCEVKEVHGGRDHAARRGSNDFWSLGTIYSEIFWECYKL